jgi:DNA-binding response OmpR family regulator
LCDNNGEKQAGCFQGGKMNPILVVEDEPYLRNLYTDELLDAGFSVCPVASGQEAIDCAKAQRPQLIVLDIMLPDINGLRVLEEIKAYDKTIPIIINSAFAIYKANFLSWMADDYVIKSSDISELMNKIKYHAGFAAPKPDLVAS